jgi:hypothetical protein
VLFHQVKHRIHQVSRVHILFFLIFKQQSTPNSMKKSLRIIILVLLTQSAFATGFFDQLCAFNFNWKKYTAVAPSGEARFFHSDKEYVQAHLTCVLAVLRNNEINHLTTAQLRSRNHLLQLLDQYRLAGNFPINDTYHERIPVFIDRYQTHCAVAYLLQQTGHEDMAIRIAKADNYAWLKDIHADGLLQWQQASGLSLEELKLIQGAYDYYEPRGFELPNKYEIPQKPSCITLYFETTKSWRRQHPGKQAIWCHGEGANGILNGRWEQNYSADLPWIIGFYSQGKRTGQWFEYYPGTNLLCRTEYWNNDKLNGVRTRFDMAGNIIEEILFKEGNAITKINYDRTDSLKWVRQPIDSVHVDTKVYSFTGTLLAAGKESVYNPGNLLWFQNIELTALNSAAISARNTIQGNGQSNMTAPGYGRARFFSPPLVEYKKEGTWLYYRDCEPGRIKLDAKHPAWLVLHWQFRHFGPAIYESLARYTDLKPVAGYLVIKVIYDNNILQDFYGYGETEYTHLKMQYYMDQQNQITMSYSFDGHRGFVAGPPLLKSIGAYDRYSQRIGTWNYFDKTNRLFKTESYLIPRKEEEDEAGTHAYLQ